MYKVIHFNYGNNLDRYPLESMRTALIFIHVRFNSCADLAHTDHKANQMNAELIELKYIGHRIQIVPFNYKFLYFKLLFISTSDSDHNLNIGCKRYGCPHLGKIRKIFGIWIQFSQW